ncbi:MAG: hypothetical protein ACR2JV_02915 [Gaiellales bacterium]
MARRLAIVAAVLLGTLAASPIADAAQAIGSTPKPQSIQLTRYQTPDRTEGLAVSFKGFDGTWQEVRVGFPSTYERTGARLPLRFDDPPAGTVERPCLEADTTVPPAAAGLNTSTCLILTSTGFVYCTIQAVAKHVPDFGGAIADAPYDIFISARPADDAATEKVYPNPVQVVDVLRLEDYSVPGLSGTFRHPDAPVLQAYPRWSKYHSGSLKQSATTHFPVLFGSLTYAGVGVYGPGNRYGAPTNGYGRNVYIDTLDSDYGSGWHRIMGVLTQPTNGTFCYEFARKGASGGKTGISRSNTYRLTAIGPGLTPVVRVAFHGPTFPFGNASYNPMVDAWGTNLSSEETAALQLQATLMGPNWARPVKGTDCAQTLRQLPAGVISTTG